MTEIELFYWYSLLMNYTKYIKDDQGASLNEESIRLLFFLTAMFVKKFLFYSTVDTTGSKRPEINSDSLLNFDREIRCIEAYIKVYHYSNFDLAYLQFDRQENLILDASC